MLNPITDSASPVSYRDDLIDTLRNHLYLCMACHVSIDELFSDEFLDKFTYEQLLTTCNLLSYGLGMINLQKECGSSLKLPEGSVL